MKSSLLPILMALTLLLPAGCGGGSEGEAQGSDTEEATAGADAAETPEGFGENTDLSEFLDEYEEYIDQYCEFTESFATANMSEMQAMVEEMSAKGMELAQYSTQAIALKASASAEAQRRLEAMEEKAQGCAEKIGG